MEGKKPTLRERMKLDKLKEALAESMDMMHDKECARIRARWMDRWADITDCPIVDGHYDYSQIDWDNKYVKLEWWMCDPVILTKLGDDKTRANGIAMLPEDVQETYLTATGPGCSKPYREVYMGMSQITHAIKKAKKGREI